MTKKPLRVIVTGSRNWTNEDFVGMQLTKLVWREDLSIFAPQEPRHLIVVHGGCPQGPDRFADDWVRFHNSHGGGVTAEIHEADWKQGLSAGFRRNEEMVRLGAWGVLGFLADCVKPNCRRPRPHGSHGTAHCLKVAKHYGIPVKAWKTRGWQE